MATRNVVLTPAQEAFLGGLVDSGAYQNVSEAIREGVRLLQQQRARQEAELEDIRRGVILGLEQAERGEFAEGDAKQAIARAFAEAKAKAGV